MSHWTQILVYFRPERRQIGLVIGLMIVATVASLLKPWPVAWIIDHVLGGKPWPEWVPGTMRSMSTGTTLLVLTVVLAFVHWVYAGLNSVFRFLTIRVSLRGLARVRGEVFECLQRMSLRQRESFRGGDLIHRASWDTFSVQTIFEQGIITAASSLLTIGFMWVILAQVDFALSLVALSIVPVLSFTMRRFGVTMRERGLKAQEAESRVTSSVEQNIHGMSLIQSYNREPDERRRFEDLVSRSRDRRQSQYSSELLYLLAIALVFGAGLALVVFMGSRKVMVGELSVGELVVFLMYLMQLYEPLNQLSHVGATVAGASAGLTRVTELLDGEAEVRESTHPQPLSRVAGRLVFENVEFSYRPGQNILDNASFVIEPGRITSIIGPSGAGKTTLIYLLVRFMDPQQGRILLDGVDIRQYSLRDLRAQISLVPQEPLLLPGTVAENIAMGRSGADRAAIEQAATMAHADEFIRRLPEGYDTLVGDGGDRFSTGQRQRLNIARAFLKDAPILLLDEPTSALDSSSEAQVLDAITRLKVGRTVLIAAHRMSTMRVTDQTLLVRNGSVTPVDNPELSLQNA